MTPLLLALSLVSADASASEISTTSEGHVQNPTWSRDGEWLSYEVNNLNNSVEMWIVKMRLGHSQESRQVRIPGATRSFGGGSGSIVAAAAWTSAPQTMVFFEGSNAGGNLRLYYANPGSAAPNELISMSAVGGNLSAPTVSGDGSAFGFTADFTGSGDIYTWNLSGGGAPAPTANTSQSENLPAFNNDGSKVAFSRAGVGEDLFSWQQGGEGTRISGGNGDQTRPIWVGDRVVYFSSARGEGHWDIEIVGSNGQGKRVLARDVRLPVRARPAITPDGSAVVWVSSDPERAGVLRFTKIDGGGETQYDTGLVACGEPNLVESEGRVWAAFTALPSEGSDWRNLHVVDVTGRY